MNIVSTSLLHLFMGYLFLWAGGFLTTFYFRIPRKIPINGFSNPPACDTCGAKIKFPNYFPGYMFFFGGRKCKDCGMKIPIIYFIIEFGVMAILLANFAINFEHYEVGIQESFLIWSIILTLLLYIEHEKVYYKGILTIIICGMLTRNYDLLNYKYVGAMALIGFFLYLPYTTIRIKEKLDLPKGDIKKGKKGKKKGKQMYSIQNSNAAFSFRDMVLIIVCFCFATKSVLIVTVLMYPLVYLFGDRITLFRYLPNRNIPFFLICNIIGIMAI